MWIFNKVFKKIIDTTIQKEIAYILAQKKFEIGQAEIELENDYLKNKAIYDSKIVEVKELTVKADIQTQELQRVRLKAETMQEQLWDRLDILRDSFTADQIWSKLWESAYSKAVDIVWPMLEKEMPRLVELAEDRAYLKAKKEAEENYRIQINGLIKETEGQEVSKLKIISLRKDIHERMLVANRNKNTDLENKCQAQLDLINILIGE